MIVEYEENGRIFHVIHDPVPPELATYFTENGHRFLEFPPVPWEPVEQFDIDGNLIVEQAKDEEGNLLFRYVYDENGEIVYEEGEEITPKTEPIMLLVMMSDGLDSVPCDIMTDYILDGEITRRPDSPGTVTLTDRTISISDTLPDTAVTFLIDGVSIPVDASEVELDEPGPVSVVLSAPWPHLEVRHDFEIE